MTERILIPLDGSKLGEAALRYVEQLVAKLQPSEKPEVTLLQVISPKVQHIGVEGGVIDVVNESEDLTKDKADAMEYLNLAGATLAKSGANVKCEVITNENMTSAAESIIKAEKTYNADLVAMSTHGRRGISRWAYGSVTDKVLHGGSVPVLMVRATNGK